MSASEKGKLRLERWSEKRRESPGVKRKAFPNALDRSEDREEKGF
jgi:hypothetical protein